MQQLFALAIFLSATLLFIVQPLTGKILLPVLGGSPAVWSTCMVFFQATLLLGYLYAHALSTRIARRWQWIVHVGLLVGAGAMLPLSTAIGQPDVPDPRRWLLETLTRTVGLPFFALSATAPLLQHWFSRTSDPKARDPYFLYAASNAGSLLGLLGYLLVEPLASRTAQSTAWTVSFWVCAALVAGCAYVSRRSIAWLPPLGGRTSASASLPANQPPPRLRRSAEALRAKAEAGSHVTGPSRRAMWIILSLVPSALLLGVTQHLTTDVVAAPLLWVVPLALYLVTLIAAFSTRSVGSARRWGSAAPVAALLVLVLSLAEVRYPLLPVALGHLAAFTMLAMLCHSRLAEDRPDPAYLTDYFVCISLGGVLGGVAAALVAPVLFTSVLEYPLAIGAAILLRPQSADADRLAQSSAGRWARRAIAVVLFVAGYWCVSALNEPATMNRLTSGPLFGWLPPLTGDEQITQHIVRGSFAIPVALLLITHRTALLFAGTAAGLLVGAAVTRTGGAVLHRERTFFGVHQVTSTQNGDWHVLTHGTTTHGVQAYRGKVRVLPTAYYHPTGPIGDVVFTLVGEGRMRDVAVVGLGAGALAAYAGNGVRMDFFEIDEAVIRIAENPQYFTYLSDARARAGTTMKTMAVDGRLGLRGMPEMSYDLIVLDAFSSDAIPTHLITREAVAMYEARLKPRGLLAFHVSSRFFDLAPVLARIAADRGFVCYARNDRDVPPERAAEGMRASVWVVLARAENDLGQIARSGPRWLRLVSNSGDPLWTDDYTNVLGALE